MNPMKSSFLPSPFAPLLWAGAALAASLTFACGDVDPQDPGAGGSSSMAGDGSGNEAGGGSDPVGGGGGSGGGGGELKPLLPWQVGNTWTYQVTQAGVMSVKTTTIEAAEVVGGEGPNKDVMAFFVVTAKGTDSKDKTESWQAPDLDNPDRIVRYRERSYGAMTGLFQLEEHWDPAKLHIDGSAARTVAGATWLESYSETKLELNLSPTTHDVRENWTVLADDESVEVPAGKFDNVIHFRKAGGGSTKEYWYVRGVGKVKETGSQTEELTEFSVGDDAP